jgi:hypothetical protein
MNRDGLRRRPTFEQAANLIRKDIPIKVGIPREKLLRETIQMTQFDTSLLENSLQLNQQQNMKQQVITNIIQQRAQQDPDRNYQEIATQTHAEAKRGMGQMATQTPHVGLSQMGTQAGVRTRGSSMQTVAEQRSQMATQTRGRHMVDTGTDAMTSHFPMTPEASPRAFSDALSIHPDVDITDPEFLEDTEYMVSGLESEYQAIVREIEERIGTEESKRVLFKKKVSKTISKVKSNVEQKVDAIEEQIKHHKKKEPVPGKRPAGEVPVAGQPKPKRKMAQPAASSSGATGETGASSSSAAPAAKAAPRSPQEGTGGTYWDDETDKKYWAKQNKAYVADQLAHRGVRISGLLKNHKDHKTGKVVKGLNKKDLVIMVHDLIDKHEWEHFLGT